MHVPVYILKNTYSTKLRTIIFGKYCSFTLRSIRFIEAKHKRQSLYPLLYLSNLKYKEYDTNKHTNNLAILRKFKESNHLHTGRIMSCFVCIAAFIITTIL